MFSYPAHLEPDGEGFVVTFRDVPCAITEGGDIDDALRMADDCLCTVLEDIALRGAAWPKAMAQGEPTSTRRARHILVGA